MLEIRSKWHKFGEKEDLLLCRVLGIDQHHALALKWGIEALDFVCLICALCY